MLKLSKTFLDHQKALWNGEAVNPKPIAWIACLLLMDFSKLDMDMNIV